MKQSVLIFGLILTLSLNTFAQSSKPTRKEKRAAKEARLLKQTTHLIDTAVWQFNATEMVPMNGQSRFLTSPYRVTLKDSIADSYLPYFGRAYSATYMSNESPMTFKSIIEDYQVTNKKEKGWIVRFELKHGTDQLRFIFSVSQNGSTSLSVTSSKRQPVTYYGNIVDITAKK